MNKIGRLFFNWIWGLREWYAFITHKHQIEIKNVRIVTEYVMVYDFVYDTIPYYLVIHSDYRSILKQFKMKQQESEEEITIQQFFEDNGNPIQCEDVIRNNKRDWMIKTRTKLTD